MEAYQVLEEKWAQFNGLDPAGMVACSSGTAALHLALEALELPFGSEVLVPDFTMIACARAVTLAGLSPVFIDCDERLLMDWRLFSKLRNRAPAAVMVVHVYGRRFGMERAFDGTEVDEETKQQTRLIEDLAEAHGVKPYKLTDAACWSFYKNKIVAGEEGGAVWFRAPQHAALARQLRSLGFTDAHDFNHVPRGHNYRMSNLHASWILGKFQAWHNPSALPWFERRVLERRQIEKWHDACCPDEWRMPPRDAPWVYDLRIPGLLGERQDRMVRELNLVGVPARHGFKPMSQQPEYLASRCVWSFDVGRGPVHKADAASCEVIYLPIRPGVDTEGSVGRVWAVLKGLVK